MADFLTEMATDSKRRADEVRSAAAVSGLEARAKSAAPPLPLDLAPSGFDIIAEAKLASPSEGRLAAMSTAPPSVAREYREHGAVAISVLTEETRFAGDISHLEAVASTVDAPVMRKDFLVDPIQVVEARAAGASGVLLIARMLAGGLLEEMTDQALQMGMFVLVELFEGTDLERAARVFDRDVLVGVNCRDLATLEVDATRFATFAPRLPGHLHAVAESGIATTADVSDVVGLGYRLALVGSSLVTDTSPGLRLGRLLEAGRAALSGAGA